MSRTVAQLDFFVTKIHQTYRNAFQTTELQIPSEDRCENETNINRYFPSNALSGVIKLLRRENTIIIACSKLNSLAHGQMVDYV